MKKLDKMGRS